MDLSALLLPFQKKWIADPNPLKVAEKGRQLGFTWIEALWSVLRRLDTKIDHWFVSADELQARQFIGDCRDWLEKLNQFAQVAAEQDLVTLDGTTATVGRLIFPNGSKITALSSSPKAIRGKRGDVTLDEFGFHEYPEEMWKAAQACKRWGDGKRPGHLHVISTHNGPATLFKQIVDAAKSGDNDFSLHRVTIHDAVAQGLADKVPGSHQESFAQGPSRNKAFIRACRRECANADVFAQEHECEPLAASALVKEYDYQKLHHVQPVPTLRLAPGTSSGSALDPARRYGELFIGLDVGIRDLTVAWILEKVYTSADRRPDLTPECLHGYATVGLVEMRGVKIPDQFEVLRRILIRPDGSFYPVSRLRMDWSNIGNPLFTMLNREFGWVVDGVTFSRPFKADAAERAKQFVEQKRVGLPNDRLVRDDICSMRRTVSDKGQLTYEGRSSDSHCDRFWALALALDAAEDTNRAVLYTPEPKKIETREAA